MMQQCPKPRPVAEALLSTLPSQHSWGVRMYAVAVFHGACATEVVAEAVQRGATLSPVIEAMDVQKNHQRSIIGRSK